MREKLSTYFEVIAVDVALGENRIARPSSRRSSSKDAYVRLLDQGWTDALRAMHPGEAIYTFWDYFRNADARNAGVRIDHLLLSPALSGRLMAAEVDREVRGWEKTSDHAHVWIEFADMRVKRPRKAKA